MNNLYQLNNKEYSHITLDNGLVIGEGYFTVIAGPCAYESEEQVDSVALSLKKHNLSIMRAGLFKPRTSPYTFQGLGEQAFLKIKEFKEKHNLLITSEITDLAYLDDFVKYVDIIQVGARNMQNFALLTALGKVDKPILLKRGFGNTINELLLASEYILKGGNNKVILCERGIRTFEDMTRNTLDLSAVALLKQLTHLPVFVDPSHASGLSEIVPSLSRAALAVGADGLLIEVHPDPKNALSDGRESIDLVEFDSLLEELDKLSSVLNKKRN